MANNKKKSKSNQVKKPSANAKAAAAKTDIKWNDEPELTLALLAAITDNPDIKQGLFPSPGANVSTAKGGGSKKITWQWQLAEIVFKGHKKYGAAFQEAYESKDMQKPWAEKIKNRINTMTKITKKHIESLGETGAGISSVDEIDMTKENRFTSKWKEIVDSCPWFFEMRELIGERPNLVPTGIGNSTSDVDLAILQDPSVVDGDAATSATSARDDDTGDADASEGPLDTQDADTSSSAGLLYDDVAKEMDSSDDEEVVPVPATARGDDESRARLKRKADLSDVDVKASDSKTAPRPGSSKA